MSAASRYAGLARNTVYLRRKVDPGFAEGWEKAVTMAVEALRENDEIRRESCSKMPTASHSFPTVGEFIDAQVSFFARRKGPVCRRFLGQPIKST